MWKKKELTNPLILDKAIGFTEQLERKIEETKEQLRETNSEEKKAQQEQKKVLDIQENHTINWTILIVLYKVQIIG